MRTHPLVFVPYRRIGCASGSVSAFLLSPVWSSVAASRCRVMITPLRDPGSRCCSLGPDEFKRVCEHRRWYRGERCDAGGFQERERRESNPRPPA
jgi:hypothetical protein